MLRSIKVAPHRESASIPLWLKTAYTAFVAVLVPVYGIEYGLAHFLWACDIALLVTVAALWRESRLLASTMAVAVLMPELAWNLDFFVRLIAGRDVFGFGATAYMFDQSLSPWLRMLSLFHVFLPLLLAWLVRRLGYDRRALGVTTLLCWIVLPATYGLTDPASNINWVFHVGSRTEIWLSGSWQLAGMMLAVPLLVYLPTHQLLKHLWWRGDVTAPVRAA